MIKKFPQIIDPFDPIDPIFHTFVSPLAVLMMIFVRRGSGLISGVGVSHTNGIHKQLEQF